MEKPMSGYLEEVLTIDNVAVYLKPGKRTIYRLVTNGTPPAFKLGGTWRFRWGDLNNWIASRISKTSVNDHKGAE